MSVASGPVEMPLLLTTTETIRSRLSTFLRPPDPTSAASTTRALLTANARYWTTVAPVVRRELRRWLARANAIDDPGLRTLALAKLRDESFHAQAGAMAATIAPRTHRDDSTTAIVALEVLFDYLDGVTERAAAGPLRQRESLYRAFAAPFSAAANTETNCDEYAEQLSRTVADALANLPAATAIGPVAHRIAQRLGRAQTRMHAVDDIGADQLERWARNQARSTDLDWREVLAGAASSVLVLHALIAAAAHPTTTLTDAVNIESAYLPMSTLLTLIDGLVDHERDAATATRGQLGYIDLYTSSDELCEALITASDLARSRATRLRPLAHHAMMLFAAVAYYTTAPGARSTFARPTCERLQDHLRPGIGPALLVMRAWRLAKRVRNRRSQAIGELASSVGKSRRIGGVP